MTFDPLDGPPPVVPDFSAPEGRKLAIICSRGNIDMVYPALVFANAALGEGVETHLFFTFWGFDLIIRDRMADLKLTLVGNTASHVPQGVGGLPGMTAFATKRLKRQFAKVGVPEVPELLGQIVDSGGHLWACRMSADLLHVAESALYEGIEGVINAADLVEKVAGAQLLYV